MQQTSEHLWIAVTVAAALFQAVRYAALKRANQRISASGATYLRSVYGLPVLVVYLLLMMAATGERVPAANVPFVLCCAIAGVTQFAGTALVVRLFSFRNFAVGTMLVRADVVATALIGVAVLGEQVSAGGWAAILLTVVGVMLTSIGRLPAGALEGAGTGLVAALFSPSTRLGLTSAVILATSYLSLREAILALPEGGPIMRAAWSATVTVSIQLVVIGLWLARHEKGALRQVLAMPGLGSFVGLMSALGTIGWFTASAMQKAAYVAAVGQIQAVFTLLISRFYFEERTTPLELTGIAVIVMGVLLFRLV